MKKIFRRIWVSATFWSGIALLAMAVLTLVLEVFEALGLFLSPEQMLQAPSQYLIGEVIFLLVFIATVIPGIASILYSRTYKKEHFPKKPKGMLDLSRAVPSAAE